MTSPYSSDLFEVRVRPQTQKFHVHADILCQTAKFKATVRGEWKDSVERIIELEGWDEETVGRLVDWLYRKDYSAPFPRDTEPEFQQDLPPRRRDPGTSVDLQWHYSSEPSRRPLENVAAMRFSATDPQPPESQPLTFQQWTATAVTRRHQLDCEEVLLAHAKLYALAGYVLLPSLQALAFTRIKEVLVFMKPMQPQKLLIGNIISLVRFVYNNTDPLANSQEPLRNLITTYIAHNYAAFKGEEVEALEEEGGDFVTELAAKVKQNVAYLQQQAGSANSPGRTYPSIHRVEDIGEGRHWGTYPDGTGRLM